MQVAGKRALQAKYRSNGAHAAGSSRDRFIRTAGCAHCPMGCGRWPTATHGSDNPRPAREPAGVQNSR